MKISLLIKQLKQQLGINTVERIQERCSFVEGRIAILQDQDLEDQEISAKINAYLEYSTHGVFNSLAFNQNLAQEIKSKITRQIADYSFMYKLKTEDIYYSNIMHSGIRAYYDELQQPKIAVIGIGNDNSTYKILPFVDKEELQLILKNMAKEDCFRQFESLQMDAETLIYNIIQLSITRDEAFKTIVEGTNYQLDKILMPLKNEFSLETQLDKLLRDPKEANKLEETIIRQLALDDSLELYQKTRLNRNSILTEAAQQRLLAVLNFFNNIIVSNS
ncbi:MAG: hypothetical protein K0R49_325 [Burkholderiales bacterium]|jgi:hypothetical protein|nr:hypothetical protein [Burkholderiales bacterium]